MRFFITTLALSFGLISCSTHKAPISPAAGEKKGNEIETTVEFLTPQVETSFGEAIFIRILRTYKNLEVSEEFKAYTNDITKKLGENSHRPALNYQTFILDSKETIAFGLPGGKVVISKGMLGDSFLKSGHFSAARDTLHDAKETATRQNHMGMLPEIEELLEEIPDYDGR